MLWGLIPVEVHLDHIRRRRSLHPFRSKDTFCCRVEPMDFARRASSLPLSSCELHLLSGHLVLASVYNWQKSPSEHDSNEHSTSTTPIFGFRRFL
jgi:hypothetical protein